MARQSQTEVIVVDYGCEQGTSGWVRSHYPAVTVIEVKDDPVFCAARARNIGSAKANYELLSFVDADVLLNIDLGAWITENCKENTFYIYDRKNVELGGFLICSKQAFDVIGGYDEAFRGWGSEDSDLYERLEEAAISREWIPHDAIKAISHGHDERQFGQNDPGGYENQRQALIVGEAYKILKRDIKRLVGKEPDLDFRKRLFEKIRTAYSQAQKSGQTSFVFYLTVPIEGHRNIFSNSARRLEYKIGI